MSTPSSQQPWSSDRRLDILVLGPMGDHEDPAVSTAPIRDAVEALLREAAFTTLLTRTGIAEGNHRVHIPDGINEQEIIQSVLTRLDTADLVLFNLTPKPGKDEASPNVFYELGLVHALGIPAFIIKAGKSQVPFYARGMKQHRVDDFQLATLMNALREPLRDFLDIENSQTNFVNDRVTQFYGLPIVDISAAVGLATGYYQNFVARLITEGGFIAAYPELIRQVVIVRPSGVDSTYPADKEALESALDGAGHTLATEKLAPPAGDTLGPLWFDHVQGVVLDLPRTIYPLQRSPRLLSLRQRNQTFPSPAAQRTFAQRYRQVGEQLLDRVEAAIRYQILYDAQRVRSKILHFSIIADAPRLVTRLLAG
jgi:nucleoside 2-deoxyribosyltransferase